MYTELVVVLLESTHTIPAPVDTWCVHDMQTLGVASCDPFPATYIHTHTFVGVTFQS